MTTAETTHRHSRHRRGTRRARAPGEGRLEEGAARRRARLRPRKLPRCQAKGAAKVGKKAAKPQSQGSHPRAARARARDTGDDRPYQGRHLTEIMKATEWQAHSVRGFISTRPPRSTALRSSCDKRNRERTYKMAKLARPIPPTPGSQPAAFFVAGERAPTILKCRRAARFSPSGLLSVSFEPDNSAGADRSHEERRHPRTSKCPPVCLRKSMPRGERQQISGPSRQRWRASRMLARRNSIFRPVARPRSDERFVFPFDLERGRIRPA